MSDWSGEINGVQWDIATDDYDQVTGRMSLVATAGGKRKMFRSVDDAFEWVAKTLRARAVQVNYGAGWKIERRTPVEGKEAT